MRFHLKSRVGRAVAAVTVSAVGAAGLFAGLASTTSVAQADPKQLDALVGVGSDTTQEVMNALAGENAGKLYTPIRSTVDSGYRQIISFNAQNPDATGDQCIAPKVKFATIYRANGSGSGIKALSRAIDLSATWGTGQTGCPGSTAKSVAGLIDFARSSSTADAATYPGTDLTFVPFARDAISYAYYYKGTGTAITDFTKAELNSIYTSNADYTVITRGGISTRVYACDIQSGSGTGDKWASFLGYTRNTSANTAAYTVCKDTGGNPSNQTGTNTGKLQENDTAALVTKGDAIKALATNSSANVQVIVGMSASAFIARANLVSFETIATGVNMGAIANDGTSTNLGFPFGNGLVAWNGSASNLTPNSTFFQSSTFGRSVFNVFDTNRIEDLDIADLFIGGTSAICSADAQQIIATFGFAPLASGCGSTSSKQGKRSGTS